VAGGSHPAVLTNACEESSGRCRADTPVGGRQTAIVIAERQRQLKPVAGRSGAVTTSRLLAEAVGHGSHESSIALSAGRVRSRAGRSLRVAEPLEEVSSSVHERPTRVKCRPWTCRGCGQGSARNRYERDAFGLAGS